MKFNHPFLFRCLLTLSVLGSFPLTMTAQAGRTYREAPSVQRTSGVSSTLPCAGSQIFYEDFSGGLPAGWTIVDGDGRVPRSETGLSAGWQVHPDLIDTTDLVMMSPSWYDPVGQSDDWLITPQISLGNNSCLSWEARSQDASFRESYEVRISSTTSDTSAFLADTALVTIALENGTNTFRTVNLSAWANQDVYIAFRQTSDDKFIFILDEVKVSNVNNLDIGVVGVDYGSPQPGDTVLFEVEVGNFGSETINSFNVLFSVAGGSPLSMFVDSVNLAPNATIFIDHEDFFISDSTDKFYQTCFWTSLPNNTTDEDFLNDTLCVAVAVGSPVGRPEPNLDGARMVVYPNPFTGRLNLKVEDLPGKTEAHIQIFDLVGREHYSANATLLPNSELTLETGSLPVGMYLLKITSGDRVLFVRRLLRE